jgi:hypothetical protein
MMACQVTLCSHDESIYLIDLLVGTFPAEIKALSVLQSAATTPPLYLPHLPFHFSLSFSKAV